MPELTMGSLFDGIGVFPLAASRHGIVPVWASEIVPDAISITKRHFPEMIHLGDITALSGEQNSSGRCDHVWLTLPKFLANWRQIRHSGRKIKPVLSGNSNY